MSNTYNVAGFSTKNGKVSVRVANGSAAARTKVLERDGHTAVDLIDLPSAMSKEDAIAFVSKAMNREAPAKSAAPKAEKAAQPAKATKTVTRTKEQVLEQVAPKAELTEDEKAAKEKNLQTMREVSARLSKIRDVA
jgi:hypothetical protein